MEQTRPNLAFIPAAPYGGLLDILAQRGHRRCDLLGACGITTETFATEGSYLSLDQVEALVTRALALEVGGELVHEVGTRMTLMSHGWLSVAALSAATARDALAVVAEHFALISPLFSVDVRGDGDDTVIRLTPAWSVAPAVEHFHLAMFFASLHAHIPKLLFRGSLPAGLRISVAHARPADLPAWIDEIGASIAFDQAHHELRLPTALTDARVPLADTRVHTAAVRRCREDLAARPNPTEIAASVRSVLLGSGPPFLDLVGTAKRLATSSRSLRRRLRAEGTSFRSVLDEVRSTIADRWLEDPRRSITEIGLDLGYTDAANFARAYRRANGLSPSAARKQRLGVHASP